MPSTLTDSDLAETNTCLKKRASQVLQSAADRAFGAQRFSGGRTGRRFAPPLAVGALCAALGRLRRPVALRAAIVAHMMGVPAFTVQGLGFKVSNLGFRILNLGCEEMWEIRPPRFHVLRAIPKILETWFSDSEA